MKQDNYKLFKEYIRTAKERDGIWWAGFEWINLSKKQAKECYDILVNERKFPRRWNERAECTEVILPSGIGLYIKD